MTKYNAPPDTSHRKPTLPPLPSLQEPLPVIGADKPAPKLTARQRPRTSDMREGAHATVAGATEAHARGG
jgi:hypothetical protein